MPGSLPREETGAGGWFTFRGLEAGDYTLTAHLRGYGGAALDPVKITEDGSEPVRVTLPPGATISGFVRDDAG